MSVTQTCRDIDQLTPLARKAIILFFQECKKANVNIFVTETYRSAERQKYLYAQGRSRSGPIVTWTLQSRHMNRMAWDIGAATLNGNSNIYNTSIIDKAGAIARKLGITWGGDWKKNVDKPHFEITSSWKIPKGYSIEGTVSIPTRSNQAITIVKAVNKLPKVTLNVADNKLEEAIAVKNYIPTLKDSTSPTLVTGFTKRLEDALSKGKINGKHWVDGAKSGSINIVDVALLSSYIKEDTIADLSNSYLRAAVVKEIKQGFADGVFTSKTWVEKAEAGTLAMKDAFALYVLVIQRKEEAAEKAKAETKK